MKSGLENERAFRRKRLVLDDYATRSTIMTSNRPLEDWGMLISDVPSATAILDRFLHHAELISITGRSYRLQHREGSSEPLANGSQPPAPRAVDDAPPSAPDNSKPAKAPSGIDQRKRRKNSQNQQEPT